jgi:hypothetical protein
MPAAGKNCNLHCGFDFSKVNIKICNKTQYLFGIHLGMYIIWMSVTGDD